MISIASTKKVQTKGRVIVSISPLKAHTRKKAATDKKNSTQYSPRDLFEVSICVKNLCEFIGSRLILQFSE